MPKQIGWSNESNLLYTISSQISRLAGIIATSGGGGGGGGTITGGGASGQVTFWNGATSITGSNDLFWDAGNSRLGIGTNVPIEELTVKGTIRSEAKTGADNIFLQGVNSAGILIAQMSEASSFGSGGLLFNGQRGDNSGGNGVFFQGFVGNTASGNNAAIEFRGCGGTIGGVGDLPLGIPIALFSKRSGGATVNQMALLQTGNLLIQNGGTFTDDLTNRLQVQGSTLLNGDVTFSSSTGMFWNSTTGSLGIGISSPGAPFAIGSSGVNRVTISTSALQMYNAGAIRTVFLGSSAASGQLLISINGNNDVVFTGGAFKYILSGNFGLGSNTDTGERLQVTGDVKITGKLALTVVTNRQTANYSLVLADNGKLVETNVGAANTITVPPNSSITFPIGSKIDLAQYGAGQTTIVPGIGVTVRSAGGALKLSAQYSGATIVKIGTDEWYLFGDITV
jgi:hypothetical protein